MSRPINITGSPTFVPSSYDGGTFTTSTSTNYQVSNGLTGSNSTSYARFQISTTAQYAIYSFNVTGIPAGATITSVTCSVKAYATSSNVTTRTVQLYSGTTAKGSAYTLPTSSSTFNLTTGTWTVSDLANAKIRFDGKRSSGNSTYYIRFYGATLTVNYSVTGTEYSITSTLATDKIDDIDPSGVTWVVGGDGYELRIDGASIDDISVEDNGTDITSSLVRHTNTPGSQTFTGIPTSFDSANSSYDGIYNSNNPENGLTAYNSSTRCCAYVAQTAYATAKLTYNFDCSSIPANAIITSVTCLAGAACYSNGQYFDTKTLQLYSGSTAKGSAVTITGSGGTSATHTINGGSWTRNELNNIKIVAAIARGSDTTQASFSFFGATLTVEYTLPAENQYYWTYSLSNVQADHTIIIGDAFIEIPEEDPQYNYYPITISSINADTDPGRGTTRVVEGSNQTITITPSESQVTLILDNGVDVSSQLVSHSSGTPSYTVATASGASYGFNLNTSTGYYVSQNAGQSNSAAVARVSLSLPVRCLVTFSYINYAEATYDYGIFGNIDSALGTTYSVDSNVKLACSTSAQNTSSVQTLTYEIESGQHFIDVKFRKDTNTNSNNDNLQFKLEITELEANNYYTYSLSNINQAHSLIFVFGNVSYYFVNTSSNGPKLYPSGQFVVLPGDSYKLTIVPEDYSDTITITDNNTNVTSSLQEVTTEIEKDGETITAVNYVYRLSNINATHTIEVTKVVTSAGIYLKVNGSWVGCSKVYKKINGSWVEQSDLSNVFNSNTIYIKS